MQSGAAGRLRRAGQARRRRSVRRQGIWGIGELGAIQGALGNSCRINAEVAGNSWGFGVELLGINSWGMLMESDRSS